MNPLFGLAAAALGIAAFFVISPTDRQSAAVQHPTPPSYVLYEELPDLTWSSALYSQGMEAYAQNEYDIALERFEDALEEYKSASHADINTAKIQYAIGILFKRLGNLDEAIRWYSDAIGTLNSLPDTEERRSELGYVYYLRGFSYLKKRDLPRALLDCDMCRDTAVQDIGHKSLSSLSASLYLRGNIYTASFYGTHSPYPVHGGTDLEVTWLDAMRCFEAALQCKGARLKYDAEAAASSDVIAVEAYNHFGISLTEQMLQLDNNPEQSTAKKAYYIIYSRDMETAVILTSRATLLVMRNTEAALADAIVNQDGKLVGYNTDVEGFYRSLTRDGNIAVADGTFFCIGAGGAGRAICAALAHHGAKKIYITDRFPDAAQKLCSDLALAFSPIFEAVEFGGWEKVAGCRAVLNASGVGMGHSIGQTPMPEEYIRPDQLYFDACYNPDRTQFLLNAEEKGAAVLNGLGMLLYQGIAQIELWSGQEISHEAMRQELLAHLEGQPVSYA